jgi:hypothetical protein
MYKEFYWITTLIYLREQNINACKENVVGKDDFIIKEKIQSDSKKLSVFP